MSEQPIYRHASSGWTTYDETLFLDGLGNWKDPGVKDKSKGKSQLTRLELLRGYEKGLALKVVWESINEQHVRKHLATLLKRETRNER